MRTIKVDLELCEGYANCVFNADDVFDLNEEGHVEVLQHEISESDGARVEAAVQSCPVAALSLEES